LKDDDEELEEVEEKKILRFSIQDDLSFGKNTRINNANRMKKGGMRDGKDEM
jgi:hypothetical protein